MRITTTWSGGIDSTALLALLLRSSGNEVVAVSFDIYARLMPKFSKRERDARMGLAPHLSDAASRNGSTLKLIELPYEASNWLWQFSSDGEEIPWRNKRIIDYLVAHYPDCYNIGLGEYIGADSWVVKDHVAAADADARALSAYLFNEYGLKRRLWTLSDFCDARFKHQRLRAGIELLGHTAMALTTNCLRPSDVHCGGCYKCEERHAAYLVLGYDDPTVYGDAKVHSVFSLLGTISGAGRYVKQMQQEAPDVCA